MPTIANSTRYSLLRKCDCCKGSGILLTGEGNPVDCPYCHGAKKREYFYPHPSHHMTKWRTEIRQPGATARFYGVRECRVCKLEQLDHPAGHFMGQLGFPCKGKPMPTIANNY